MSLYAYLCVPARHDGNHNTSPVVDWLDARPGRPGLGCKLLWPPMTDGLPERQAVLCLLRGATSEEADDIAKLDGVHALGEVDRSIAWADNGRAKQLLDTFGVPAEARDAANTAQLVNRLNRWLVPERKLVVAE